MSPEQVRGDPADHRSDIFSFGAVFHEMLSGKRPFTGETTAEVMTAILKEDPPELAKPDVSPGLERVVKRCLEKRPEERFQSARDIAFALEAASGAGSIERPRAWLGPIAAALAAARRDGRPRRVATDAARADARARRHGRDALHLVASRGHGAGLRARRLPRQPLDRLHGDRCVGHPPLRSRAGQARGIGDCRHRRRKAAVLVAGQPVARLLRERQLDEGGAWRVARR